jgi:hypothetical protein
MTKNIDPLRAETFIWNFIHSSMALQPFVVPRPLLQFRNIFYTDGRNPWRGDKPLFGILFGNLNGREHLKN